MAAAASSSSQISWLFAWKSPINPLIMHNYSYISSSLRFTQYHKKPMQATLNYKKKYSGLVKQRGIHVKRIKAAAESDFTGANSSSQNVGRALHLVVSLGSMLAMDKVLKKGFEAAAIKFPSALFGMFCIFSVLTVVDLVRPAAAMALVDFFEPATTFIQRWLPLFYVPSLVVLPLAVKGIPVSSAAKIGAIIVGGWVASLCVAGYTAITVRRMVKTKMIPAEPMPKPSPFSRKEIWFWTTIFTLSFILAVVSPMALGTHASTCLPFLLAATVLGYIIGSGFPSNAKKLLHPIITCALSADLAVFAFGTFTGSGFESTLGSYLTKNPSNPGAGDIFMGFLGSVILSFAFSMFRQRKLVKRHATEIFTAVVASTVFSLYSTAAAGRMIGLEPALTVSILPRCITVALALNIVSLFEGLSGLDGEVFSIFYLNGPKPIMVPQKTDYQVKNGNTNSEL